MFEKEAEEYQIRKHHQRLYGHKPVVIKELNTTFKDGAEFGYNKANEWQFVSEKGLPKESGRYFVYVGGGEKGVYPLDFETEYNDFGYWCLIINSASLGVTDTIFETITERNEDKVIAWKEIVLPELKGEQMSKEELEKEAEEKAKEFSEHPLKEFCKFPLHWTDFDKSKESCYMNGYLAGAEPREKRIAELEVQIEKMKCDVLSLIKDRMNDDIDQNIIERLADKWEIKEND